MTFSIRTFSIMTQHDCMKKTTIRITTFSIMTISIRTFCIMTLSITTLNRISLGQNIKKEDTQHNDTWITLLVNMQSAFMLVVTYFTFMLNVFLLNVVAPVAVANCHKRMRFRPLHFANVNAA